MLSNRPPALQTALTALPAFPGSKKRLVLPIFALLAEVIPPAEWPGLEIADAFAGSGAFSVSAKFYGFGRVHTNDIAGRSAVIARALVQNSSRRLSEPEVLRLFETPQAPIATRPTLFDRLAPVLARFLEGAVGQIRAGAYPGVARDLVTTLLIKWLARAFPMGLTSATDASRFAAGELDTISGQRLKHYLAAARQLSAPRTLLKLADDLNHGVLPGSAVVTQEDAFAFLPGADVAVAYLDPPYPGTQSYESAFQLVDELFGFPPLQTSPFSGRDPPLDALIDACRHIPLLLLSLNNGLLSVDEVTSLVGRHRTVLRTVALPYRHYAAVATPGKNATNREILVISTK